MDENELLTGSFDDKATSADEGIDQLAPDELKGQPMKWSKWDRSAETR